MSDCISPTVQLTQPISPDLIPGVDPLDLLPERQAEAIEVSGQIVGIRISSIEFAILEEYSLAGKAQACGREVRRDMIRSLGVKVPAERLELGRQKQHVRLIELKRSESPAWARSSDASVCGFDVLEGSNPVILPDLQRTGGHGPSLDQVENPMTATSPGDASADPYSRGPSRNATG